MESGTQMPFPPGYISLWGEKAVVTESPRWATCKGVGLQEVVETLLGLSAKAFKWGTEVPCESKSRNILIVNTMHPQNTGLGF